MKKIKYNLTLFIIFIFYSYSGYTQEIAILDQGLNTNYNNRGEFYNPLCMTVNDNYRSHDDQLPLVYSISDGFVEGSSNFNGSYVSILRIGLCSNSFFNTQSEAGANVPRFRSLNDLTSGPFPKPFEEVALVSGQEVKHSFTAPFINISFGGGLRHGTDVADAAFEFDSSVRRKMVQIYHISTISKPAPTQANQCNVTFEFKQSSGVIGGTDTVLRALDSILENPDGVDAVNFSIVFRQPCGLRELGKLVPQECQNEIGKNQISALKEIGIPVVVGLANTDIEPNEVTWPACLDDVIMVGADNGNSQLVNGGIGIGSNIKEGEFIFYADNENSFDKAGSSMAAPKVAAAYALLAEAVPQSTVDQRTEALIGASSDEYQYDGFLGSVILRKDIDSAIEILELMVASNLSDIGFNDSNQYGSAYEESSDEYTFEIDFDNIIGFNRVSDSIQNSNFAASNRQPLGGINSRRDVTLSFDTKMSNSLSLRNGVRVWVNNVNTNLLETGYHSGEKNHEMIINRNMFQQGTNVIRLVPYFNTRLWGVSNIEANFIPAIKLEVAQIDNQEYGYLEDPTRYTGLRTFFELDNLDSDYELKVTGWDIDNSNENQVFLNGVSLGYLSVSSSSSYNRGDTFTLEKETLSIGQNVIEFVQNYPNSTWSGFDDEKWAVKDIKVDIYSPKTFLPSILYLLDESSTLLD